MLSDGLFENFLPALEAVDPDFTQGDGFTVEKMIASRLQDESVSDKYHSLWLLLQACLGNTCTVYEAETNREVGTASVDQILEAATYNKNGLLPSLDCKFYVT